LGVISMDGVKAFEKIAMDLQLLQRVLILYERRPGAHTWGGNKVQFGE
jgi:hypothetical protein